MFKTVLATLAIGLGLSATPALADWRPGDPPRHHHSYQERSAYRHWERHEHHRHHRWAERHHHRRHHWADRGYGYNGYN